MNDESTSAEPGGVTPLASNLQAGKFLTVAEVACNPPTLEDVGLSADPFRATRSCAVRSQLSGHRKGTQHLPGECLLQRRLSLRPSLSKGRMRGFD